MTGIGSTAGEHMTYDEADYRSFVFQDCYLRGPDGQEAGSVNSNADGGIRVALGAWAGAHLYSSVLNMSIGGGGGYLQAREAFRVPNWPSGESGKFGTRRPHPSRMPSATVVLDDVGKSRICMEARRPPNATFWRV